MTEQTTPTDAALTGQPPQANASTLIHDGAGAYLLHLRDDIPGIWEPGAWSLLGGGREPGDRSLEETARRELREEAGLELPDLTPFSVEQARGSDGRTVPIQIFASRWAGDPATLNLTEGVMLHWFRPEAMPRLRMAASTRDLIRRHAESVRRDSLGTATSTAAEGTNPADQPGPPATASAAGPGPTEDDVWETILRLARRFDAHEDARGMGRTEQWTLQVLKIAEETGEASQAVIGARGTNPRKGDSHTWLDVHAEVADVIITGMVALARMRPDDAEQFLRCQLAEKSAKFLPAAPAADRPSPEEPA